MAGMRAVVDPPAFTPIPYGLATVVDWRPIQAADTHWLNGITYEPTCSPSVSGFGATTYDECIAVTGIGAPPAPAAKVDNVDKIFRGATPFTCYVEFDCSAVGNADAAERARDALSRSEGWQLERGFWTGRAGGGPSGTVQVVWPHLASNAQQLDDHGYVLNDAATQVTGGASPMHVVEALGLLEGQLADCYAGAGVVHIPQRLLPTLDAWGLVKTSGSVLKTLNGNRVAVGAGYPGTSPAGTSPTAGGQWMYATGAVFGYRGDVQIFGGGGQMDRSKNTIKMIAERTYVLGWDCCLVAALAAISVPT